MPQSADFGGFYYDPVPNTLAYVKRCDGRNMPTVAPTIARIANTRQRIINLVIAKSAGSGEPVFTLMDALLHGP
jgi:hypothetical protein